MALPSPIPLLRSRYSSNEYCFLQEIRDAAGHYASRSADAIAMNFWPSRGLPIHGFEIKSIRSDWIKEIKSPEKAESLYKFCDYWWLVCAGPGIAKTEEIPDSWGFMEVSESGKRLKIIKEAPKLTPTPPTKDFLATMLKRATQGLIDPSTIKDKIDAAKELGKQMAQNDIKKRRDYELYDYENLKKSVEVFEQSAGFKIKDGWEYSAKEMGEAVKFISANSIEDIGKQFKRVQEMAQHLLKKSEEALILFPAKEKKIFGED